MFGSTSAFGQSSTSPFGQQQGFGQPNTATNNPFAPKPFGSPTTTFGAQTGSSLFGNTSTGAFGQQQSTPTFGTPSSSPFGSSTPAFGASPTPAFGATSSTFGSGSLFGQKPSFGAFGSSPSQSSPFGSTFQQTQPAFGSNTFGATTTPAFGATATPPAFGATTSPAFGVTTTQAFGATTAPAFGTTTTPAFGASTTPTFGSTSTSLFGATNAFGSSTPGPAFGTSGTTAFGVNSSPGFGVSSTPAFGFGSSPSVGQTATSFGSSPFASTNSTFGAQTSTFGSQSAAPPFGQAPFGNQAGGSRIKQYAQTADADSGTSGAPAGKLDSISAMPEYKDKSHEELRWEDYQRRDKGGPNPSGAPTAVPQPTPQQNPFSFNQVTPNPFPSTQTNNPFAKSSTTFGSTSTFSTSFNNSSAPSSNPFTSSINTTQFGQPGGSLFPTSSPSLFSNTNPSFASSSLFGTSSTNPSQFCTGSLFTTPSTQSVGLFQSSPALVQHSSSALNFSSSGSLFNTPSLFGNGSSPFSTPTFQQSTPAQASNLFSFQPSTQPALFGGNFSNTTSQAPIGQRTIQSNMVMQPAPVSLPYGTLPAMPQMSIGNAGSSPSVQYGISSLSVAEKPLPSQTMSMLVPRHLSQRRIKLHPRKYNPISDSKVPFFVDDEESPATPKADAFFIPRENPRSLIIRPIDQWPSRSGMNRQSVPKDSSDLEKYKGASAESERGKAAMSPSRSSPVENGNHHEPGAVSPHGNGASIERLMPKLSDTDYFTEPSLEELAAKERAEPGYCSQVRDFIVGHRGYGSIKFLGVTDVRGLDLESIVEFNNREVIVFKDDSKKPPVGEGLNKAAEVTLLNIKCMNKKTREPYREAPRVQKYKEMLVKKAEEQGAEFVSFDAVKGEWKFRVKHFSAYGFW